MPRCVRTAHIFGKKWRSDDVRLQEEATFSSLLLPEKILVGLKNAGYITPSPIQLESIPVGRFGRDLLVQAKSGTGKTLVFTIIALECLTSIKCPQVLIMAPTREIAIQICDVVRAVGSAFKGLTCNAFIGGLSVDSDVERVHGCQIVVGTPGRLKHLISQGILAPTSVRLLVLDEADILLESSFKDDLDYIFVSLPKEKQVIATSATYPKELKSLIRLYFRNVFLARLNYNDLTLLGMVHYIQTLELPKMSYIAHKIKLAALEKVLTTVKFAQCLVFCNSITKVEGLCYDIKDWGFTSTYISSAKEQSDRIKAIECLKRFKCKILVTSDVTSRGIDAENVDLVINFDKPINSEIYFHRCGRAGRYGAKGVAITLIEKIDVLSFEEMKLKHNLKAYNLPDPIPANLISIRPQQDESSEESDVADDSPAEDSKVLNHHSDSATTAKKNKCVDSSKLCNGKTHLNVNAVVNDMNEANQSTKDSVSNVSDQCNTIPDKHTSADSSVDILVNGLEEANPPTKDSVSNVSNESNTTPDKHTAGSSVGVVVNGIEEANRSTEDCVPNVSVESNTTPDKHTSADSSVDVVVNGVEEANRSTQDCVPNVSVESNTTPDKHTSADSRADVVINGEEEANRSTEDCVPNVSIESNTTQAKHTSADSSVNVVVNGLEETDPPTNDSVSCVIKNNATPDELTHCVSNRTNKLDSTSGGIKDGLSTKVRKSRNGDLWKELLETEKKEEYHVKNNVSVTNELVKEKNSFSEYLGQGAVNGHQSSPDGLVINTNTKLKRSSKGEKRNKYDKELNNRVNSKQNFNQGGDLSCESKENLKVICESQIAEQKVDAVAETNKNQTDVSVTEVMSDIMIDITTKEDLMLIVDESNSKCHTGVSVSEVHSNSDLESNQIINNFVPTKIQLSIVKYVIDYEKKCDHELKTPNTPVLGLFSNEGNSVGNETELNMPEFLKGVRNKSTDFYYKIYKDYIKQNISEHELQHIKTVIVKQKEDEMRKIVEKTEEVRKVGDSKKIISEDLDAKTNRGKDQNSGLIKYGGKSDSVGAALHKHGKSKFGQVFKRHVLQKDDYSSDSSSNEDTESAGESPASEIGESNKISSFTGDSTDSSSTGNTELAAESSSNKIPEMCATESKNRQTLNIDVTNMKKKTLQVKGCADKNKNSAPPVAKSKAAKSGNKNYMQSGAEKKVSENVQQNHKNLLSSSENESCELHDGMYKNKSGMPLSKNKMKQNGTSKKGREVSRDFSKTSKSANLQYNCATSTPHSTQTKSAGVSNENNRIKAKNQYRIKRFASNYYSHPSDNESFTSDHHSNRQRNHKSIPPNDYNNRPNHEGSPYNRCYSLHSRDSLLNDPCNNSQQNHEGFPPNNYFYSQQNQENHPNYQCNSSQQNPGSVRPNPYNSLQNPGSVPPYPYNSQQNPGSVPPNPYNSQQNYEGFPPNHCNSQQNHESILSNCYNNQQNPGSIPPNHCNSQLNPGIITPNHYNSQQNYEGFPPNHCNSQQNPGIISPNHYNSQQNYVGFPPNHRNSQQNSGNIPPYFNDFPASHFPRSHQDCRHTASHCSGNQMNTSHSYHQTENCHEIFWKQWQFINSYVFHP